VIAPARTAALDALRAIGAQRVDLPAALVQSRSRLADDRDRALAADIITGTLRWQRSLDCIVAHFARRPVHKLDEEVLTILRLSLYQLLHLDRVPASAVVDDAVDMTRGARKQSAAGFVNAVLRSTLRQRHRLPLPDRPDDGAPRAAALAYLGVTHSHPEWLVGRWLDRYGFDATEKWVRFNNDPAPLTLRANTLRVTRDQLAAALAKDGIEVTPTQYAPSGLVITAGNPLREPAAGAFVVQDEASQLVSIAVGAAPGMRVLDLCASPGGKTTALAADMHDEGIVVASDVRPRRIRTLRATVRASGTRHVHVLQVSATGPLPFAPVFDRVLVDAPCSGLGTIRRDPDIRWRRSELDLPSLAERQFQLAERAARVVAPGGRLVYATCSSEPEENERVVERLIGATGFRLHDLRAESPLLERVVDDDGTLRTLPYVHHLEAFFAAALISET
jgi:16S rRNA (cytosine967-C5)-methyltransferase